MALGKPIATPVKPEGCILAAEGGDTLVVGRPAFRECVAAEVGEVGMQFAFPEEVIAELSRVFCRSNGEV
jgi:hypothetical protein